MVVRNVLQCIACESKIITRTQLGHRDKQQHSFPCPKCGVSISYAIDLDQKHGKWSFQEPKNARWTKSEEGAVKILTFSDEIPVPVEMGGMFSPFLATWWNIEDQDKYRMDEGLRQLFIHQAFPYAERCLVHFEREDWTLFDKESPPSSKGEPSVRDRLVVLYNAYRAGFSKFALNSRGRYDRILQRLTLAQTIEPVLFNQLASRCLSTGDLQKLWHEIGSVRRQFINVYPNIQSLLQMRYWKSELQDLAKFKISDKKFNELRQLYIDCFETLFRLLVIGVGIEATIHHRELRIPTRKAKMTLEDFAKLPNGAKIDHIKNYPVSDMFLPVLDIDFRNSIGHHSAHYEADSDTVVVYESKGSKINKVINYTDFCNKVLDLFAAFELAVMYHNALHLHVDGRFA